MKKYVEMLNIDINRVISLIFILLMIVSSIHMAYEGKELAATISIVAFSFGLVFLNLDKFSKFKGAGFEAELRLKDAVTDAYAAIDELKKVALNVAEPTISLLAVSGPFQYLPLKYKLEYANKISKTLQELNVSEEETELVLSSLYDRVEEEHKRKILVRLNKELDDDSKIFSTIDDLKLEDWEINQVIKIAEENNIDVSAELADYKFFIKNKTLRNPDDWQG